MSMEVFMERCTSMEEQCLDGDFYGTSIVLLYGAPMALPWCSHVDFHGTFIEARFFHGEFHGDFYVVSTSMGLPWRFHRTSMGFHIITSVLLWVLCASMGLPWKHNVLSCGTYI